MYTSENSYALRNKKNVLNGINSIVLRHLSEKLLSQYFHRAYMYTSENSYALRNKKKKVLNGINSIVVRYLSEKLLSQYFHRAYLYEENNMIWVRIHQPFSRTFFVLFSRIFYV